MSRASVTKEVEELILILQRKRTLPVRVEAIRQLTRIGGPRAVRALCAALTYKDAALRKEAADALAQLQDAAAVGALSAALSDSHPTVREAVIKALEAIGTKSAAGDVDREWYSVGHGWTLEAIGTRSAAGALRRALSDAEPSLRRRAALALANIGDVQTLRYALRGSEREREAVQHALTLMPVEQVAQVLADLFRAVNQHEQSLLDAVFRALGQERTTAILKAAVDSTEWGVAVGAVKVMAKMGVRQMFDLLTDALRHQDAAVRHAAACHLAGTDDHRLVEPFMNALRDTNAQVRRVAASALTRFADSRMLTAFLNLLNDDDRAVRQAAAQGLGRIGDMTAVDALCAALQDKAREVRQAAAEALGRIGHRAALPALQARAKRFFEWNDVKAACRQAIEEIERATAHLKDLPLASNVPAPPPTDLPIPATSPQFDPDTLPRAAAAPPQTAVESGAGIIGWLRKKVRKVLKAR
ncbi:MAG: HEAT repeat domain-containing protein [Abditibacteriales bacterium]|nr:HEAT repeat domain-containing protein [Abditibacteriales bacterium]